MLFHFLFLEKEEFYAKKPKNVNLLTTGFIEKAKNGFCRMLAYSPSMLGMLLFFIIHL